MPLSTMRAAVVILALLPVLALASRGDPTRSSSGSEYAEVEHVRKLIVGGSTAAINDCASRCPPAPPTSPPLDATTD